MPTSRTVAGAAGWLSCEGYTGSFTRAKCFLCIGIGITMAKRKKVSDVVAAAVLATVAEGIPAPITPEEVTRAIAGAVVPEVATEPAPPVVAGTITVSDDVMAILEAVRAGEIDPKQAAVLMPRQKATMGVSPTQKTRAYYAGVVLGKHGMKVGVTKEMIAEVDAAYSRPNPIESEICLRNAWHAIRAFTAPAEGAVAQQAG